MSSCFETMLITFVYMVPMQRERSGPFSISFIRQPATLEIAFRTSLERLIHMVKSLPLTP
jgi:hypothetical protein